ncbi:MAG: hypothetical protein COX82_04760 [Candidatus Magasanikbacteria bacterium CG_4_10_14_0_2_um_filter_41_10]|uniref:Uncharacterized protein n=1 Tax=Candidatus Magasanikbacteria bacterium CG_4_10_14_0_2_um_filter_41_10 TaxID=1974638 RepID=A0A2M7V230_9BACT|nr:MAG: hypothetical protein COX82_04760 [Candidatus Magasanikbacteria bacterium CG_4_10_14_0_2_um_filter_41_10]
MKNTILIIVLGTILGFAGCIGGPNHGTVATGDVVVPTDTAVAVDTAVVIDTHVEEDTSSIGDTVTLDTTSVPQCEFDVECDLDEDACTLDRCVDHVCVHDGEIPGCCSKQYLDGVNQCASLGFPGTHCDSSQWPWMCEAPVCTQGLECPEGFLCDETAGRCKPWVCTYNTDCDDGDHCLPTPQGPRCKAVECPPYNVNIDCIVNLDDWVVQGHECIPGALMPSGTQCNANTAFSDGCRYGTICRANGRCEFGSTIETCDDSNPCTADSCDSLTGCVHLPVLTGECSP